jgi:cyclic pyranopterin phosphate synthase
MCLFANSGIDLRALLRGGHRDEVLSDFIGRAWHMRNDRYSEQRTRVTGSVEEKVGRKVEMSYIGG